MTNGQCGKCESSEVHVVASIRNEFVVPLGFWSATGSATNLYICVNCGYVEIYVQDKSDLAKIANKWPKVAR
jgi:predicted nucleic-acid-binding Zn-ribbon protein